MVHGACSRERALRIGVAVGLTCGLFGGANLLRGADAPIGTATRVDEPFLPPMAPPVSRLVRDLDHADFAVRAEATRALFEAGAEALPALQDTALRGSREAGVRAVSVLQQFFTGEDRALATAAEEVLDELAFSKSATAANRAGMVLDSNYLARQDRAIDEIRRLGGQVTRLRDERGENVQVIVDPNDPTADPNPIQQVVIGSGWRGGDDGLRHVKRITRLRTLYVIQGVVSEQAVADLSVSLPNLRVQMRGRAYLGIGGAEHPSGCQVVQVKEGGPAALAGIAPGDVVTEFGGKPVESFDSLIKLIALQEPGKKVPAKLLRGDETVEVSILLTDWPKQ